MSEQFPPSWTPGGTIRGAMSEAGWRGAIRRIAERHGLAGDALPYATGSDVVWRVGEHVVKLTTPEWSGQMSNEIGMLERVRTWLPIATPEVVEQGVLDGWPYLVMTRLAGTPVSQVWGAFDAAARQRFATRLGEILAALHAIPVHPDEGWPLFIAENIIALPERQAALNVPPRRILEAINTLKGFRPGRGKQVLLHTEILGEHVLVDGDGLPCAIIDFADARVGEADYEWAAAIEMIFSGDLDALKACLAAYGRRHEPRVLLQWALVHRFLHLSRMARYAGHPGSFARVAERLFGVD